MSQWRADAEEFAKQLRFAADCVNYYLRMSSLNDCNTCGDRDCKYKPWPGEQVRINCPLWKGRATE